MTFLLKKYLKSSFGRQFLKVYCLQDAQLQLQSLKTASVNLYPHKQSQDNNQQNASSSATKKHKETLKITLLQNQNMIVTGLEDAKNLAKRRSMNLVKVMDVDPKTQRPVYKLLTAAEMLQEELSEIKATDITASISVKSSAATIKKPEKSLSINSRIGEHDLASRLKNILKWLNKQHEVRILIQASSERDLNSCEKIFKAIEEAIKTPLVVGKILQKRTKGNAIKFSILPVTTELDVKTAPNSQ